MDDTPSSTPPKASPPAWKLAFGDLIRTIGDYVLTVLGGTTAVLILSTLFGYLPYSDRPGPGWYGPAQTASLSVVWVFLSWSAFASFYVACLGLVILAGARLLELIKCPRWLIRVVGALISGYLSMYVVAAMGWYLSIAAAPIYFAGLLGCAFGAFLLLPDAAGRRRQVRLRHWLALGAPCAILAVGAGTSYVRSLFDQRLELVCVQWHESAEDLLLDEKNGLPIALTDDEMNRLRSAGLRGRLRVVSSSTQGSGPESRMVIVMKAQLASRVALQQPDQTAIIYVQDGQKWNRYPDDAHLLDRTVELKASDESPSQTLYWVQLASGARMGGTAASW